MGSAQTKKELSVSNHISFQRKLLHIPIVLLALLTSGCGDGSSANRPGNSSPSTQNTQAPTDSQTGTTNPVTTTEVNDNSNNDAINNQVPATNTQQYEGTYLSLSYPEGWTLDTSIPVVDALFLEPGLNGDQRKNNCALISSTIPGLTLVAVTDGFISVFDETPDPQVSFVNVNGSEMSRTTGKTTASGVAIDSSSQVAYKDGISHNLMCRGVSAEDVKLMFDSMTVR